MYIMLNAPEHLKDMLRRLDSCMSKIAGMANRCIWLENRSAAREATRYLLANGHRRIACVTSDLPIIDRQERLDGYRQALEEYGISPDPRWVINVPFNEEGGERAAHQLIKVPLSNLSCRGPRLVSTWRPRWALARLIFCPGLSSAMRRSSSH